MDSVSDLFYAVRTVRKNSEPSASVNRKLYTSSEFSKIEQRITEFPKLNKSFLSFHQNYTKDSWIFPQKNNSKDSWIFSKIS